MKIPLSQSRAVQSMSNRPVKPTVSFSYAIDQVTLVVESASFVCRSSNASSRMSAMRPPQKRDVSGSSIHRT